MKKLVFCVIVLGILTGCGKKDNLNLVETELLKYGLPITIKAPKTATFEASNLGGQQEVTISDTASFYGVLVYSNPIQTNDVTKYKTDKLLAEKSKDSFTKLIQEDRDGFIYETQLDEETTSFQFSYFIVSGNNYYTLENVEIAILKKEEAIAIYNAIRTK